MPLKVIRIKVIRIGNDLDIQVWTGLIYLSQNHAVHCICIHTYIQSDAIDCLTDGDKSGQRRRRRRWRCQQQWSWYRRTTKGAVNYICSDRRHARLSPLCVNLFLDNSISRVPAFSLLTYTNRELSYALKHNAIHRIVLCENMCPWYVSPLTLLFTSLTQWMYLQHSR